MRMSQPAQPQPPIVRHVQILEIVTFAVRDDELTSLEEGSPATTMFAISMLLIGAGVGCLGNLQVTPAPAQPTIPWIILVVLTTVALVTGLSLLTIWSRLPNRTKHIIKGIRGRDVGEGTQEKPL